MRKKEKKTRIAEQTNLRGDASDVKARATKGPTLLDARGLETKLGGLDGGHITTRSTSDDNDVVLIRSRSEAPCKRETETVLENINTRRVREIHWQHVCLSSRKTCHRHFSIKFFFNRSIEFCWVFGLKVRLRLLLIHSSISVACAVEFFCADNNI